jgi:type IV pilus assembly protein PilC
LGTLVASGVPILEALNITRDTSGNATFEKMYSKVADAIREGEAIAKPMKENSVPGFHPMALFFWITAMPVIGGLLYLLKMRQRIVDDIVINMVDVGEETGELDTMLMKVADTFDVEVKNTLDRLLAALVPATTIVMTVVVAMIMLAIVLPIMNIAGAVH